MYPRIPWELVADPLGYAERTLGTTDIYTSPCLVFITLGHFLKLLLWWNSIPFRFKTVTVITKT
jgi:hypothetical protein